MRAAVCVCLCLCVPAYMRTCVCERLEIWIQKYFKIRSKKCCSVESASVFPLTRYRFDLPILKVTRNFKEIVLPKSRWDKSDGWMTYVKFKLDRTRLYQSSVPRDIFNGIKYGMFVRIQSPQRERGIVSWFAETCLIRRQSLYSLRDDK